MHGLLASSNGLSDPALYLTPSNFVLQVIEFSPTYAPDLRIMVAHGFFQWNFCLSMCLRDCLTLHYSTNAMLFVPPVYFCGH